MNSRSFRLWIDVVATPKVPAIEAGSTDTADKICKQIALEVGLITQRLVGPGFQVSVKKGRIIY